MSSGKCKMVNWKDSASWGNEDGDRNFEPKVNVGLLYSLYLTLKLSAQF